MKKKIKDTITRYIILAVILTLMLLSPIGDRLQSIFDKTILPYLDYPSNIYLTILAILFLLLAFWHNCKRLKEKILMSNNWLFTLGCTNLIIFLFWIKGSYSYAPLCNHIPFFTYINCFVLINFTYIAVSLINWIRSERAKFVPKSSVALNPGKPIHQDGINEDYEYTEYIDSVSPIIIDNFDEQVSVSVGISGAWGSGKTTFLHALQVKINENDWVKNNDRIVIEFKPWFCEKKTDLVQEFFKVYREHMGKRISGFDSDILEYAKVLTENVDKLKWVNQVMKLCTPVESIQKQFDAITDKLKRYKIPVYIIIDDLDRLDGEEIMEILRLIRITANFPYTQFILAYDKPYIQKAIRKQLDYDESERFIDKVINTEICLPHFDHRIIGDELYDELIQYSSQAEVMRDLLFNWEYYKEATKSIYESILPKLLPTHRDVYRFVNMFKLDYDYFRLKSAEGEIFVDFKDYFTLSIIKYSFPDFYAVMKIDSDKLFKASFVISLIKEPKLEKPFGKPSDVEKKRIEALNKMIIDGYEKDIAYFNYVTKDYNAMQLGFLNLLLKELFEENEQNANSSHHIRRRRVYNQYFQFKTIDYAIYRNSLEDFVKNKNLGDFLTQINKITNKDVLSVKSEFSSILSDLFISYVKENNIQMLYSLMEFTDVALKYPNVKKADIVFAYGDYLTVNNSFNSKLWITALSVLVNSEIQEGWDILLPYFVKQKVSGNSNYTLEVRNVISSSKDRFLIYGLYHYVLKEMVDPSQFIFNDIEIINIQIEILKNIFQTSIPMKDKIDTIECIRDRNGENGNVSYVVNEEAKDLIRDYIIKNSAEYIENFIYKSQSSSRNFNVGVYPMPYSRWVLSRTDIEFIFMKEKGENVSNYDNALKLWNWLKKNNQEYYEYNDPTQTKTVDQWIAEGMPGLE